MSSSSKQDKFNQLRSKSYKARRETTHSWRSLTKGQALLRTQCARVWLTVLIPLQREVKQASTLTTVLLSQSNRLPTSKDLILERTILNLLLQTGLRSDVSMTRWKRAAYLKLGLNKSIDANTLTPNTSLNMPLISTSTALILSSTTNLIKGIWLIRPMSTLRWEKSWSTGWLKSTWSLSFFLRLSTLQLISLIDT